MKDTMLFYLSRFMNEYAMTMAVKVWSDRYKKERLLSSWNSFENAVDCAVDLNRLTRAELMYLGFHKNEYLEDVWNIPCYLRCAVKADTLLVGSDGETIMGKDMPEKMSYYCGCIDYGVREKRKE